MTYGNAQFYGSELRKTQVGRDFDSISSDKERLPTAQSLFLPNLLSHKSSTTLFLNITMVGAIRLFFWDFSYFIRISSNNLVCAARIDGVNRRWNFAQILLWLPLECYKNFSLKECSFHEVFSFQKLQISVPFKVYKWNFHNLISHERNILLSWDFYSSLVATITILQQNFTFNYRDPP